MILVYSLIIIRIVSTNHPIIDSYDESTNSLFLSLPPLS